MILGDFKVSWRTSRHPGGTSKGHGGSKSSLGTFFLEYLKDFLGNIRDPGDLKGSFGPQEFLGDPMGSWRSLRDTERCQSFVDGLRGF